METEATEIGSNSLTTKLQELEEKLEVATNQGHQSSSHGYSNGTKTMYTVKPWRLEYNGESFKVNGEIWHFCRKDHWSNGTKYNGMYCKHTTEGHDEWRRDFDAGKAAKGKSNNHQSPIVEVVEPPKVDGSIVPDKKQDGSTLPEQNKKKLALSDNIQAALATQVGMTPDHWKSVWDEACEETGNQDIQVASVLHYAASVQNLCRVSNQCWTL